MFFVKSIDLGGGANVKLLYIIERGESKMEKKNMVLLTVIAVATLLVAVVGATFAYFTATITDDRGSEGRQQSRLLKPQVT